MKDIEKIKSEDLGCQVADANPGNFGIEQEVGAMVGATVPAPTEPSADDARELGAQLLVFLRRALLPIQSALRTALAAIYAHLDSRCTDYTPAAYAPYMPLPSYDPMRPFVPRTLPNLLTAITAFSARKISDLGDCPDGISLVHLLCGANNVTEIKDDNTGWVYTKQFPWSLLPNVTKLTLNCKAIRVHVANNRTNLAELNLPDVEEINAKTNGYGRIILLSENTVIERLSLPKCKSISSDTSYQSSPTDSLVKNNTALKYFDTPSLIKLDPAESATSGWVQHVILHNNQNLVEWNAPNLTNIKSTGIVLTCPKLIKIVVGAVNTNFNISGWNPSYVLSDNPTGNDLVTDEGISTNLDQFLQNFLEHICQNLANRTGQTKLTLTLSAGVYTAIMTDKDIKAELVARNWKVTDGTNNYNN